MINVANHIRIFDPNPTDDLVNKRGLAVKDLGTKFARSRNLNSLLAITNSIASAFKKDGQLPDDLASSVEEAIRAHSPAFLKDGEELQMRTIALLGIAHALKTVKQGTSLGSSEIIATSLWLGLGFQSACSEPKLEALRVEVMLEAREFVLASAAQRRLRADVIDLTPEEPFSSQLPDASIKIASAIRQPIDALKKNAQLDREELDFLWWALSDYSEVFKQPLSSLPPVVAALAAGIEAADKLAHLPCDAHKYVVFRHIRDNTSLTLHNLATSVGSNLDKFSKLMTHRLVEEYPAIFWLFNGLATAPNACDGADVEHLLTDWSARAFLEAAFLRLAIQKIGERD